MVSRTSAKDYKREVRFMTFMKDVFSMFAPPPPVPYSPPKQPMYLFSPVPPPIHQNDEKKDDEEYLLCNLHLLHCYIETDNDIVYVSMLEK